MYMGFRGAARAATSLIAVLLFSACSAEQINAPTTPTGGGIATTGVTPAGVTVWEDWSAYTSLTALMSSTKFVKSEDVGTNRMAIDKTVFPPGRTASLRYDYPATAAGNCNAGPTIRRALQMPAGNELWLEWTMKFSAGFQAGNTGCAGGLHSHKTMLLYYDNKTARVQYVTGRQVTKQPLLGWGGGPGAYEVQVPSVKTGCATASCYDGQWHTYRMHVKLSSSQTATDGVIEFWVDGTLRYQHNGISTYSDRSAGSPRGFWVAYLGANMNSGAPAKQSIWWGPVGVWTKSPGW